MKKITHYLRVFNCIAVLAALTFCASARAGGITPAVTPKLVPATPPKSVFEDEPDKGIDPFFPTSTRRSESMTRGPATNSAPQSSSLFNLLQLKGISGVRGERLAIINGYTVAVGEVTEIRCGGGRQVLKVRCREIRDESVVLELDGLGEVREFKLRTNI
jgi:hypothetical protein